MKGPCCFWGYHGCGVPMGGVCECCVFAVSTELDLSVSRGPVGGQRAGVWAGVLVGPTRVCAGGGSQAFDIP